MNRLIKATQLWAKEKGLDTADPAKQFSYIEGFPRHVISTNGKIVRLGYEDTRGHRRKPIVISERLNEDGYLAVRLNHEGRSRTASVHRLLAESFIPNTENKETVNHIDGVKTNNNLSNLEWATRSEQNYHAYDNGLRVPTEVQKVSVKFINGKPVRCLAKETGKVTYHLSARDCSKEMGYSTRWCDKIISEMNGDTRRFELRYVELEEVVENVHLVSFETLSNLVGKWAIDKELHSADPAKQMLKSFEEMAEVSQAFMRGQEKELEMEVGDVLVTIVILALQLNINLADTLGTAYDKISNRNGKLVDGTYMKESDL